MPCLTLYGFSDVEAQALALSPDFYATSMIIPASEQTQPIWARVVLVAVYPDARKYLSIPADACEGIYIDADAEFDAYIQPDADTFIVDDAWADVLLRIAADAEKHIDAGEQEADIVLTLAPEAHKQLALNLDGDATLALKQDAQRPLVEAADSDAALNIAPDAEITIDIEASDTMEAEVCQES